MTFEWRSRRYAVTAVHDRWVRTGSWWLGAGAARLAGQGDVAGPGNLAGPDDNVSRSVLGGGSADEAQWRYWRVQGRLTAVSSPGADLVVDLCLGPLTSGRPATTDSTGTPPCPGAAASAGAGLAPTGGSNAPGEVWTVTAVAD